MDLVQDREKGMAQKIRRGDLVLVVAGKDRGKQGRVQRVITQNERVVVEGVNIAKRHMKPRPGIQQAGIVTIEVPLSVSNVMLVCPHCSRGSRMSFSVLEDGKKIRVCKRCKEAIE